MIVLSDNQSSTLFEIDKSLLDDVKLFLNKLTKQKQASYSYIDEFGDKIVVENGIEMVVPSKEDIESFYNNEETFNEDEVKKLLHV